MSVDPVLARRARIGRLVAAGKRLGYTALLVAMLAFFAGAALSFPGWTVALATVSLVIACVALPPAMVFGYAVRAAEREDRAAGS